MLRTLALTLAALAPAVALHGQNPAAPLLLDIAPGAQSSSPRDFVALGSRTFFTADDGQHGRELWISDGTAAGTRLVVDLAPGPQGSDPAFLVRLGTRVAFVAEEPTFGREVWISDGTAAGTRLVANIAAGSRSARPYALATAQGQLFFWADDQIHGGELWVSDGTESGTRMVKDIAPGYLGSDPRFLTAWGARLAFTADDRVHGRELWISDGTAGGTYMVADMKLGAVGGDPHELTPFGGLLCFRGFAHGSGIELLATDGTANGTFVVHDTLPGTTSGGPRHLLAHHGRLYYVGDLNTAAFCWDGNTVIELLRGPFSYAAESGFFPIGDAVLFAGGAEEDLWISNGTTAGTHRVIPASSTAPRPQRPNFVAPLGYGRVLFGALDAATGQDLWVTDGTEAGTVPFDLVARAGSSYPQRELDARTHGGAVIASFSPDVGFEPRLYAEGALAQMQGEGWAADGMQPTLWSADPALGATVHFGGSAQQSIVVLGVGAPGLLPLAPGMTCYLDLFAAPVFVPLPLTQGVWEVTLTIPADAQLAGLQLSMQAFVPNMFAPLGFDVSPGIVWTLR